MRDVFFRRRRYLAHIMECGEIHFSTMGQAVNHVRSQVRGRGEEIGHPQKHTILEGFEFCSSLALLDSRSLDRMILVHREGEDRYLAFDGAVVFMFCNGKL